MGRVVPDLLGPPGIDSDLRTFADGGGLEQESRLAPVRLDQGDPQIGAQDGHHQPRHAAAGTDVHHPCPGGWSGVDEQAACLGEVAALRLLPGDGGQIDSLIPPVQLVEVSQQPRLRLDGAHGRRVIRAPLREPRNKNAPAEPGVPSCLH